MKYTTRESPIDIFREFPDIHSMAKRSIRLHPRSSAGTPANVSKMGGAFLHPKGEPWPRDPTTGQQYYPVLQVMENDLPKVAPGVDPVFPFQEGTDCFQLLWLSQSDGNLPPRIVTRWLVSTGRSLSTYQVPYKKDEFDLLFPKECKLYPEEIVEYPHRWALSAYHENVLLSNGRFLKLAEEHGEADNPLAFYQLWLCCAPGAKLSGHPHWVQYPEWPISDRGFAMEHLLTVSSREWDRGNYRRWKPIEDGSLDTAEGPNDDADLMLGDAGDIYVCVSRQERDWPVKAVFQCS
jgi:hypothetical protein